MDITCSAEPCPIVLNSTCVFYEGDNLIYTGIVTNDNLQTALQKIDQKFQDAGLGYIFSNGIEQLVPGGAVMLGGALNKNTTIGGLYNLAFAGTLEASALITTGGSSTDFVKGDGSLDSTSYQPAGNYISNLTGDVLANGPGSVVATLATVFGAPGTYGNSGNVPSITVDGKGRITNVTPTPINYPAQSLSFIGDVEGLGFTGSPVTLTLDTVNTDVYGSNNFLKFAVNGKGLITSATPVSDGDITTALGYVPVNDAIELTINGVAHDLTSNRSWNVGTVNSVGVTAGLGISASVSNPNTNPVINIVNTAPDQTVRLNAGVGISIAGSYPNFTITNDYPDLPEKVTSFSSGNLVPLFTTSVANPTTTPALSFALANAAANTVFAGPDGGSGAPTYRALVAADLPSLSYISSISTTAPLATTGGLTPTLSISQANSTTNGYLSSTDWNTFNNKTTCTGTVTSVDLCSVTSGVSISGGPITTSGSINVDVSTASASCIGLLTSTDWNTFNNKQDSFGYTPVPDSRELTINGTTYDLTADRCWSVGTVTSVGTSGPLTGGTITGSGTIGITQADGANDGYLSSTDWSTFNGKQPVGSYITDLTGDGTASGPGSACLTLASVNLTTGTFGSSTQVPVITVNGKGLVTCVTTSNISGSLEFVGDVTGVGSTGTCTTLTLATVNSDVYASETLLNIAVNGKGLITSANPTTSGDICSVLGYTPEDVANKSTCTSLGSSNTLYPTQLAVKTYVDSATAGGIILQGSWDASTNTPDISGTTTTGWAWRVDVAGNTNLGGITDWQVGDLAVKSATGWVKIDNSDGVTSVFGRFGSIVATTGDYLTCQVTECDNLYYTDARVRAAVGHTAPLTYCSITGVFGISQSNNTTDGYLSSVDWNTFNDKQSAICLTTAGSSGPATLFGSNLNIPDYGSGLTGYVPYSGAVCPVNLGIYYLYAGGVITPDIISGPYSWNFLCSGNLRLPSPGNIWGGSYDGNQLDLSYGAKLNSLRDGYVELSAGTTGGASSKLTFTHDSALGIGLAPNYGTTGQVLTSGGSTGAISWQTPNSGTVTCVAVSGTNIGVTGSPITSSGTINLSLSGADVCSALGFSPYNSTNPAGYTTCTGTVTNVASCTSTAGVLLSGSPITTSGTLGIDISTASATCTGLLTSTDWNTFNSKTSCTGTVTNVATSTSTIGVLLSGSPITSSGTLGINISNASTVCTGLLTAADWNTFNNKTSCLGTVTSVGLTSSTTGVSIGGSPITSSGNLSLNISTASSLCTGLLSSADWNTFNGHTACTGTVTSVNATGTNISVTGGPITTSGTLAISLSGANVCSALGYTPYNATNPNGYTTCVGTVTSVGVVATNINVCFSPVTTSGNICLNLTGANVCSALGYTPTQGSGTTNYLPKFTAASTIGNSIVYDDGTNVGIGTTSPAYKLDVSGTSRFTGNIWAQSDLRFGTDLTGANTAIIKWQGAAAAIPNSLGIFTWGDAKDIQIGGNNVYFKSESGSTRLTIASTGAATFSSNVLVGGATSVFANTNRGLLEVNGTSQALLGLTIGNSAKAYMYHNGTDLSIYTYTGQLQLSNSSGNILIISGTSSTFLGSVTATTFVGALSGNATTSNYGVNNSITSTDLNNLYRAGFYSGSSITNGIGGGGDQGIIVVPTWQGTDAANRYTLQIGAVISGALNYRTTNISGVGTWKTVLDNSNYNSYSPTLTGGGASGTWGINITGNAATATSATDSTKLPLAGGTMTGTITFSPTVGNKIDFYYSGDDRYGIQVQSSELRIHSGAQGASSGGITLGKSTGSVFTEYLRVRNDGIIQAASYLRTAGVTSNAVLFNAGASTVDFGNAFGQGTSSRSTFFRGNTNNVSVWWGGIDGNGANIPYGAIDAVAGEFNFWRNSGGTGGGTWTNIMTMNASGLTINSGNFIGNLTGNAATATYATNSTRLYASDAPYTYGGAAPYYMYMTYDGGSYWELKVSPATPGTVRVAYANSAGSATTAAYLTGRDAYTNGSDGWFRSNGNAGWYSASYAVGIYATDTTWVRTYNNAQFYSSTIIQAGASMRAPIFYDADDTTYYLDPNASSSTPALKVAGNIDLYARSSAWGEGIRIRVPSTNTWGGIRFTRDRGSNDGNWAIGFTGVDATDDLTFWSNNAGSESMKMRMTTAGTVSVMNGFNAYSIQGNGNVDGTGNAAWFPSGLYSGSTQWFYGTMYRNGSATYYSGGGLYDVGTINGNGNSATLYPNNGSYGSWKIGGSKNGWVGVNFDNGNTLMMNSNESGIHQEGYGWKFRWYNGSMYISTNSYGGGAEYTVIHSGNIASYTAGNTNSVSSATSGAYTWTGAQYFQSNLGGYCGSLSNPPLQAYATSNNSAFFSFHKSGIYAVNMGLDADNVLRIGGWSASANRLQMDMSGNLTMAGDVTAYSDARVKTNIKTIENALDKVLGLRGVSYTRTDSEDKKTKIGVIAQETLPIVPEVVNQDNDGMYNVSYGNFGGLFIEAFKEQQKQIEELKLKLDGITK